MTKQKPSNSQCPFWCNKSKRCTASTNGLFIPLEDHIATYCTSENHPNCHLYQEEIISQQNGSLPVVKNRRKHPRIPSQYPLIFSFINDTGSITRHATGKAETINLSNGGMQISTRKPLFNNSIVRFSYGKSAPTSQRLGLARVKWCRYHQELLRYTVGLSFYRFKKAEEAQLHKKTGQTS